MHIHHPIKSRAKTVQHIIYIPEIKKSDFNVFASILYTLVMWKLYQLPSRSRAFLTMYSTYILHNNGSKMHP